MNNMPNRNSSGLREARKGALRSENLCRLYGDKLLARPLSARDVAIILDKIRHRLTLGDVCNS